MMVQSQPEGYRIKELVGRDTMESVRPLWEQWQTHPYVDFDFFSTIVNNRQDVVNPVALVLFNNDIPVAMAVGRIEKVPLPIRLGYLKVSRRALLQLTIVYDGLMGKWDDPGATVFVRYLRQMMRRDHIDAVHLAAMRSSNPVYKTAYRQVPFFLLDTPQKNNLHWWADLPETFEVYQKKINSKHRTQLRSKERKFAEHCGGTIQVKIFHTPQEVSLFCTIAEKIAQATYLRGLGEGFYDNPEMRKRLDLEARKGWMQGFVLYANENPCAFWLGIRYNHVFYLEYTGFDSDLKDYAPGQILFIKMIESLCTAGGIRSIDFGFGDATYKQRYGDRNWEESDLYLFNNTPSMFLTNLARKSATLARFSIEKILKRFDLFARIKKRWRLSAEKALSRHIHSEEGNK
jgi:hypothetical protein